MFFQHQRSEWSLLSFSLGREADFDLAKSGETFWFKYQTQQWKCSECWHDTSALGEATLTNSGLQFLELRRSFLRWRHPSVRVSVTTLEHCAATSGETCRHTVQSRMAMSWRKLIFERSLTTNGCFLYSDTCLFWVWNMHVPPQHMEEESGLANCATKIKKWGSTKSPWKLVPLDEPGWANLLFE